MPNSTGAHLRAEQAHALDVRVLAAHVLGAHVDDALEPEARADGRGRDAVLAGAGLGDDAPLAEPRREQAWPSALLILWAPVWQRSSRLRKMRRSVRREPLGLVERRRPADVVLAERVELRRGTTGRRSPASQPRSSSSSAGISVSGT